MSKNAAEAIKVANRSKVPFYKKKSFKDNVFVATLLAWPIIHFLVFWVYVNGRTLLMTFQRFDVPSGKYVWDGATRFIDFFSKIVMGRLLEGKSIEGKSIFGFLLFDDLVLSSDIALHNALINSFRSVFLNIIIILPIAYFAAYVFYKKIPGEKFFRVFFFFPSMISIVVLTLSFRYLFDSDFGPVAMLIKNVFGYAPDWFSTGPEGNTVWPLIYIYCVWAGLGYNVILISGAMQRIPMEIRESARLDGASFFRECFSIVLPLSMPTVGTYVVLGTLGLFGFMMQPMLLAGGGGGYEGKTLTIALHIFNLVNTGNTGAAVNAATIGIVLTVVGSPMVFLSKKIMDKLTPDVEI